MKAEIGESAYLAWLASAWIPADSLRLLLDLYGTGEAVYHAFGNGDKRISDNVPTSAQAGLRKNAAADNLNLYANLISEHRIETIIYRDPSFPDILSDIEDPVSILFYQGNIECLSGKMV